ncbi:hypothetical protein PDENDC454_05541 [Paenibacillus dendritiformis C454]|uniref:DUF4349 domain-containing protein n=2 Tax=Paenibacillus dendritiformis TaxID=130049 RepID=H3SCB7_9BACL|nr:DUF4349 domain-containing protein [Paenibacillus dendritiformis]EHQ63321.1 hypothetical protein PDENDC454_05541 [Paenibacillus dendritiformis C454]
MSRIGMRKVKETDKREGRMRRLARFGALLLGMLMLALAAGCGAVSSDQASEAGTVMNQSEAAMDKGESLSPAGAGFAKQDESSFVPADRKLIYEANIRMEVKNYEAAKQRLQQLVEHSKGYVLQFSDQESESERGGSFVIKVPAAGFTAFLDELGTWEVLDYHREYSANDVTEEYVDLEARLTAQRAMEARLLAFMEKATRADDLVQFSSELGSVQSEIEQIVGRKRYLDNHVAMSTVNMRLYQPVNVPVVQGLKNAFGTRMANTLVQSWEALVQFVQVIILFLTALLPFACAAAIVGVPIWLLVKRRRGRRRHPQSRVPGHPGGPEEQRHRGTGQDPAEGADGKPEADDGPAAEAAVPAPAVEPAETEEQGRSTEGISAEADSENKK